MPKSFSEYYNELEREKDNNIRNELICQDLWTTTEVQELKNEIKRLRDILMNMTPDLLKQYREEEKSKGLKRGLIKNGEC